MTRRITRPIAVFVSRLRNSLTRLAPAPEVDEELRFHLDMAADAYRQQGLSESAARAAARRDLGDVVRTREACWDRLGLPAVDSLRQDVGYALRLLGRSPGYTAAAMLTLGLGVGANTAVFGLVHDALLRPLPYAEPDRLAYVWVRYDSSGQHRNPASAPELLDLQDRCVSFAELGGIWASTVALTGDGDPEQIRLGFVTWNFLLLFGVSPALGRHFEESEQRAGTDAIILSHGLWRRRYGGDPGIVGRVIQLEGYSATVVGVMPAGFQAWLPAGAGVPDDVQAWTPFAWRLNERPRDLGFIRIVGRLAPAVSIDQANDELNTVATRLRAEHARDKDVGLGFEAVSLAAEATRDLRPALIALLGAVIMVLLIACVNVANLQYARLRMRAKELAVRAAIGAGRGRLVRQLLVESLTLSMLGGLAGLGLARVALDALIAWRPDHLSRLDSSGLSWPVLGFTFGVCLVAGVLVALVPMVRLSRGALSGTLRDGGRLATVPIRDRVRAALVVVEVSLSIVVLIGAVLMARTLVRLADVEPGFRADGVLTFQVSLPRIRYADDAARASFARRLEEAVGALPGVRAAGAISALPLDDQANWYGFYYPDGAAEADRQAAMADQRAVTPGFFAAIGATLVEGRLIDRHDDERGRRVVVVDEELARATWADDSPIGRGLHLELNEEGGFVTRRVEVVGVVRHIRHHDLRADGRPQVYIPHPQSARAALAFTVRTDGRPESLALEVGDVVRSIDPALPVSRVAPMREYVRRSSAGTAFTAALAGAFAAVALLLALVGIHAVVSYGVVQRVHEIGVRLALGARPTQVLWAVMGEGARAALVGLVLGLAGALVLTRFIEGLLFEVSASDPATYAGVAALLVVAALVSAALPARRAARVDPLRALRGE